MNRLRQFFYLSGHIALLTLTMTPRLGASSEAQTLYQEAVMKETGERDPEAAIALYQKVIERAGQDYRMVSKARLRLATCYEHLGKNKEAEQVYLDILKESSQSLPEAAQAAHTNLGRLQAEDRKPAATAMTLVKEFQDTRATISMGPVWVRSGRESLPEVTLALRYRLSPARWPLSFYAEGGTLPPINNHRIQNGVKPSGSGNPDLATLDLSYQAHLALIAELPHEHHPGLVPEIGCGAAMTASHIEITNFTQQELRQVVWSPYFAAGLHVFADRPLSLLLAATYTPNPFGQSIQINSPPHPQSFDFPNSLWTMAATLQLKIGWTEVVLRPQQ